MSNLANKSSFRAPNRTLRIRPGARSTPWIYLAAAIYFLLLFAAQAVNQGSKVLLSVDILLVVPTLLLGILSRMAFKAQPSYTLVDLNADEIRLDSKAGSLLIDLNEVDSIRVVTRPLLLSSLELRLKDGTVVEFPHSLERSDYIVEALVQFRADLASSVDFGKFRTNAILADHRFSRWQGRTFSFVLRSLLLSPSIVLLGYVLSYSLSETFRSYVQASGASNWLMVDWLRIIVLDLLIGMAVESTLTIKTLRRLKLDSQATRRDINQENLFFRVSYLIYLMLALLPYLLFLKL